MYLVICSLQETIEVDQIGDRFLHQRQRNEQRIVAAVRILDKGDERLGQLLDAEAERRGGDVLVAIQIDENRRRWS